MVRYDGGHKLDRYITDTLGRKFRFLPVCPEVECGMTTPREPMRLEGDPTTPRLVDIDSRIDRTEQMLTFCRHRVRELETEGLCGFIFKKNSPSCGLHGVPVFASDGMQVGNGSGLFAAAVARHFPHMLLVEEGELSDAESTELIRKKRPTGVR
ncbi:MAG: DUF523 domain-containing protein [Geobacter sp.]|nr:DUF523 domain-containing protein [Geobacter sp.]